jgi:hypothetical protein
MDIEHWRREIDEIDKEILRLLNLRARLAIKVGTLKKAADLPFATRSVNAMCSDACRNSTTDPSTTMLLENSSAHHPRISTCGINNRLQSSLSNRMSTNHRPQ